ncbi:MAG: hypothetical protein AB7O52_12070 [Planctomycetota bacterium]
MLALIDVDGDGQANEIDRFIVDWWLVQGGSLSTLLSHCTPRFGGLLDASDYFGSSAAQLPPPASESPGPNEPVAAAPPEGSEGQTQSAQGSQGCAPPAPSSLPSPVDAIVGPTTPNAIQLAVDIGAALIPTIPYVIQVEPGTYTSVTIDPKCFPRGLTLFASGGPASTIVNGGIVIEQGAPSFCAQSTAGRVQIGAVVASTSGVVRHGFRITLGTGLDHGGGIRVIQAPVSILGNEIVDNDALLGGGGVAMIFTDGLDSVVAHNLIANNEVTGAVGGPSAFLGAGVYQQGGDAVIADNTVVDNVFGDVGEQVPRRGGGIALEVVDGGSQWVICRNDVARNTAQEGAGVYLFLRPTLPSPPATTLEVIANLIRENETWLPLLPVSVGGSRYAGLGLYLEATNITPPVAFAVSIVGNEIRDHDVQVDPPFDAGAGPATESGGGLFVDAQLTSFSVIFVEGNAIYRNTARVRGGGAYVSAQQSPGPGAFRMDANTLTLNELDQGGLGAGLFVASGSTFAGTSNVVRNNVLPFAAGHELEYFAELPQAPTATALSYSLLPPFSPAVGGANLEGFATVATLPGLGTDYHIAGKTSPAIDSADPGLTYTLTADIDGEPRALDILGVAGAGSDRGADEATVPFVRGDANGDGVLNLSDAVVLLAYLFSGQALQNCLDAYDANDMDTVNLADSVYLLGYLFSGGPPPPAPFPTCGPDETPEATPEYCVDASFNNCP